MVIDWGHLRNIYHGGAHTTPQFREDIESVNGRWQRGTFLQWFDHLSVTLGFIKNPSLYSFEQPQLNLLVYAQNRRNRKKTIWEEERDEEEWEKRK